MLGDNMDLSNYSQKDCINGLTKEDAQKVKEIPEIEESIDGINSHITNMSSDIEDLQIASINFADHFDTLDGKVSNLESGLSDLDDEITEINNVTIANISTQVNTIQNSTIPALDARIGTIENSEIPDINSNISDINDAIDTINNTTIPDLQTDIEDEIQLINDGISGLDVRVTDLENNPIPINWKPFTSTDWSSLSDINGKANQDLLMIISFIALTSSSTSNYSQRIDIPILICKGYNFNQDGFVI